VRASAKAPFINRPFPLPLPRLADNASVSDLDVFPALKGGDFRCRRATFRETMKAYLDNNVISATAKNDTPPESDALKRLLNAYEEGKVDLVTSEVTLQEINAYQGPASIRETFQRVKKVPIVRWDQLLDQCFMVPLPPS
jgi:hypothetical protein